MANSIDYSQYTTYNGDKPFVFISYAHKDSADVFPVIKSLQERGYRVWFDIGIEAGTEWANNIAAHLKDCAAFIVFISKSSMASENCLDEIAYAKSHQKPSLMIFMEEEVDVPEGIEMQTARFQRMYKNRHASHLTFIDKICEAAFLEECKDDADETNNEKHQPTHVGNHKKTPWLICALALAVIVISVMAVALFIRDENGEQNNNEAVETTTETTAVVMSDDPYDFTVKINDTVYQFPCNYDAMIANGWTISSSSYSPEYKIKGVSKESYSMANSGCEIYVISYNPSGNSESIKNSRIVGAEFYYDDVIFELPGGITNDSTIEDIINAYGNPNEINEYVGYSSLKYYANGSDSSYISFNVYFSDKEKKYSSVRLINPVVDNNVTTETNKERPKYLDEYVAPTELGDDITSGIIKLEGDLYKVPSTVSAFLDNGWKIVSKPGFVVSGGTEYISLQRGDIVYDISVYNFAEYQTTPENCAVRSIHVYASDDTDIELPGGITLESTMDEIATICNAAGFRYYDGYSHSYTYSDYENEYSDFYLDISVSKETKRISSISLHEYIWIQ
ncbi:MAG: toll/interleukin-1 receptor domain-containing protein [Clostridia bacterium]|nr:toll/interleukin-1 receptor domain-containing protein [Clostridia bacterium]